MKFPTLTHLPSYKKFDFEPRYYDPVKEDIEHRTSRIKQELGVEQNSEAGYTTRIKGSFRTQKRTKDYTPLIRLLIAFILIGIFFGYLYLGSALFSTSILILMVGTVGVFLFLKLAGGKRKSERKFFK